MRNAVKRYEDALNRDRENVAMMILLASFGWVIWPAVLCCFVVLILSQIVYLLCAGCLFIVDNVRPISYLWEKRPKISILDLLKIFGGIALGAYFL